MYEMEDCPICFETIKNKYTLSCNHCMCMNCSRKCREQSTENCINIDTNFSIYIKNGTPIKCPLCRCVEQKMTVDEFKEYDPDCYSEWMQLELNCDEYGESYYIPKSEHIPNSKQYKQLFTRPFRIPRKINNNNIYAKMSKWNTKK